MEGMPTGGEIPENKQERGLSFEEQVALAEILVKAVNERNNFILAQGGFDTFAEAGQYVDGAREAYDEMEAGVNRKRKEFDEKVLDKEEFIKKFRTLGDAPAAEMITRMFNLSKKEVPKKSTVFSRFFRER